MVQWETMRSFLKECYRDDHVLSDKKFFEWQFQAEENDGMANVVCAWDKDELLGMHGYVPWPVRWGNRIFKAAWTLHWLVRPDAPKGLGWLLMKKIQDRYELLMSINASKIGKPFVQGLGWVSYAPIPRFVGVLNKTKAAQMLMPEITANALDHFIIRTHLIGPHRNIVKNKVQSETYRPDWSLYPALSYGTVRSEKYFHWRYRAHPMFKYDIITLGNPERPAVCVFRIEKACGSYETYVGRIVDFFYPNDSVGKEQGLRLLKHVLHEMNESGCTYVDFICSSREYGQAMIDLGGQEEPTHRQVLPSRLAPIQNITYYQNIVFRAPPAERIPKIEEMYITKSDIDGDSPASIGMDTKVIVDNAVL